MHHAHRSLRVARTSIRASSSSAQAVQAKPSEAQSGRATNVPGSRSWAAHAQASASAGPSGSQSSGPSLPQQRTWSRPQPPRGSASLSLGDLPEPILERASQRRDGGGNRQRQQDYAAGGRDATSRQANRGTPRSSKSGPSKDSPSRGLQNILRNDRIKEASATLAAQQARRAAEEAADETQQTQPTQPKPKPASRTTWAAPTIPDDANNSRGSAWSKRSQYKERGSIMSRLKDEVVIPSHSRVTSSRSGVKEKEQKKNAAKAHKPIHVDVFIPSVVSVGNLAKLLNVRLDVLRQKMIKIGMEAEASYDHMLTSEYASLVAMEFNRNPVINDEAAFDIYPPAPHPDPSSLSTRPPVVTIMGHVDHGKTTLLDTLRSTSVAKGEAGGITQHIGAFSVPVPASGNSSEPTRTITFLDTPGHAAFSAMRARGASVTDVVVLVVAADDGIMPQTREVIDLVKNSPVGLVVAINKVDKPGVDVSKVEHALLAEGVQLEAFGGDVPVVHVSGLTGQGLDQLVETISVLAEMQELHAEREGTLQGYVLESKVAKGLGPVATVLVLRGGLKPGQHLICGTASAKIRVMNDSSGKPVKAAYPGMAVTVSGWKELPDAGDEVLTGTEAEVKKALANRLRKAEMESSLVDLEAINEQRRSEREREREREERERATAEGEEAEEMKPESVGPKELRLIIKGDVSGSVEAVKGAIEGIGNDIARVKVVSTGVGDVAESDVLRAKTAEGTIIAFNVKVPRPVESIAQAQHVPILASSVIYKLIDDVTARVVGLLPPIIEKRVSGEATVLALFDITLKGKKTTQVGGCRVSNGVVAKNKLARVVRNGQIIHEGRLDTLKQHKNDVMELAKGNECGLNLADFNDLRVGDIVEMYEEVELPGTL